MGDRWLGFETEPEPPALPRRTAPAERRPVVVRVPARRHPLWSLAAGVILVGGVAAGMAGAWLVAASQVGWNEIARDTQAAAVDLADGSRGAAATLTGRLAELESTDATLTEVSAALDAADRIASDLEAVADAGLYPGPGGLEVLVGEIDRLAGAIDAAFPGLTAAGIAGGDGPGDALRAAGEALLDDPDVPAPPPVTGFGPFVLQYPLPGYSVTDPFGTSRGDGFHNGIDIGAPSGTPILAAADGVVLQAGWLDDGAGNGVIVGHEGGWETRYFHMVSADLPVTTGDRVVAGQVIGNVGSTGWSTGPHLHFEIVYGPLRMDPARGFNYFGGEFGTGGHTGEDPGSGRRVLHPALVDLVDEPIEAQATLGSTPEVLSGVRAEIAEVQRDLRAMAAEASTAAVDLTQRRADQQHRARTAALTLYGGTLLVVLGLLLLWLTRPQRV